MKSAFVAIVGRPSSGKSTLLIALCGHKVSIVSPIPQTTRNQVRGIVNRPQGQVVFLDTPGFHLSEKKFNLQMMDNVVRSLKDADVVIYTIDASRPAGAEENALIEKLKKAHKPLVLALNKMDFKMQSADSIEAHVRSQLELVAAVRISALKETNLDALFDAVFAEAKEGQAWYPEEYYTDQDPSFRIGEIIREQAINRLKDEIPHAIYVEVADAEVKATANSGLINKTDEFLADETGKKAKETLWIRAFITVDRESQVGIIVGKDGAGIKAIRVGAQKELGKIFSQHIQLDLRVKVNAKWRTKDHLISGILGSSQPKE
jgi:GTP-binding protein Era